MKETELGELVVAWLKEEYPEWELFQEIRPSKYPGSPVADIVLINQKDEVWIIELKTSLNLDVIRQAFEWDVEYRSIAIPRPKRPTKNTGFWFDFISEFMNLGTLLVNPATGSVHEVRAPEYNPSCHRGYHKSRFVEICRSGLAKGYAKAGTQDGGHWTPYKESMKAVREYIERHPGCGVGDIVFGLGKLHYASEHSARTNIVKSLNEIETDWCEVRRKGNFDTFYVRQDV